MCHSGVEMFEYRLSQSPVESKVLLPHTSRVPVCKQNRINGHVVDVGGLPLSSPLEQETCPAAHVSEGLGSPTPCWSSPTSTGTPTPPPKVPRLQHRQTPPAARNLPRQGMLSRKDRKIRLDKNGMFSAESRMSFEDRVKSKFNLKKSVEKMSMDSFDDPDDPYAFPDPSAEPAGKHLSSSFSSNCTNISDVANIQLQTSPSPVESSSSSQQHSPFHSKSPGDGSGGGSNLSGSSTANSMTAGATSSGANVHTSGGGGNCSSSGGGSSIAKLYPELAEKLERVKPKIENKGKGRSQGSSTVNRLQTKIAQNKIKDKLKKITTTTTTMAATHIQDVSSPQTATVSPVCNPCSFNPLTLDLPSAISKETTERLKSETEKSTLPLSYDGANTGLVGQSSGSVLCTPPPPSPPPPPPFLGFQTMEQLHSSVSSQRLPPSVLPQPQCHGLMPPPPYPGLVQGAPVHLIPASLSTALSQPPLSRTFSSQSPVFSPHEGGITAGARHLSPEFLSTIFPVLQMVPRRPKRVLSEKDARTKLKTDSSLRYYSYYVRRKIGNHHYLHFDVAASDGEEEVSDEEDVLPWQQDWFSASSDEEEDEPDDELALHIRTTKLALMRARLRRQCSQSKKSHRSNTSTHRTHNETTMSLIRAAREKTNYTIRAVHEIKHLEKKPIDKFKKRETDLRFCRHKNDEEVQCSLTALPYANHCQKHIMYNVDQQLFDYCTAKFADNTQCCDPVFDIRHELPLCPEHATKADNYNKSLGTEVKSRPRKKTRPSALTRPPKKGKKKKNQRRNVRPQKPIPPTEPTGDTEMPVDVEGDKEETDVVNEESSLPPTPPTSPPTPSGSQEAQSVNLSLPKDGGKGLQAAELENFSPDVIEKSIQSFELPLEQASRLLEDQDLHDVFNKLPDDAFDIFGGRNGDYEPSREETEELERALAEASKDVMQAKETLEALSQSMTSEDLTKHLTATLLGQTLNTDELGNPSVSGSPGQVGSPQKSPSTPMMLASQGVSNSGVVTTPPITPGTPSHMVYTEGQASGTPPRHLSPQTVTFGGHSAPAELPQPGPAYPATPKRFARGQIRMMANMPQPVNTPSYVPFTTNQSPIQAGSSDMLRVRTVPVHVDQTSPRVLPEYRANQNRTLRQQLSVTLPQPHIVIQRHLQMAGSQVASSSPGRHNSAVVSLSSPVTLSVHSPIQTPSPMQSPLPNARPPWPAGPAMTSSPNSSAPVYAGYQNGFPMNHAVYSYQALPGSLKYTSVVPPQVKTTDKSKFIPAPHSIGVPGSQVPTPAYDKGNSSGTKIT